MGVLHMRILFAAQNFRQGWGSGPESVRLIANQLSAQGVVADVFDAGYIRRDVGQLPVLPEPDALSERFPLGALANYSMVVQAGPWQNALHIGR